MPKPRTFPGFTARPHPWWTSIIISLICGVGGLVWGFDYLRVHPEGTPFDDNLVSQGAWGWAFLTIGAAILVALAVRWGVARRRHECADHATTFLTVAHVFGLALCVCACIAVWWSNHHVGTGERVAFSLFAAAVLNGIQVVRVPTELHRVPMFCRRFAVWLRE